MHFSVAAYNAKATDDIKFRIAEQKQALGSIIRLLSSNTMPQAQELSKQLTDLAKIYEGITSKYTFVEPTHDTIRKITTINSTNEVAVSKEQIEQIAAKVLEIRKKITNVQS